MTPYFVSALRNEIAEDAYWRNFANAMDGQGVVLTYSFLNRVPDGTENFYGDPANAFRSYTALEKETVRNALSRFEAVADIRFKQASGVTDLQFGQFDIQGDVAGYARYPVYNKTDGELVHGPDYGDVWLDSAFIEGDIHLVLHEVGHALGLEHPFEGTSQLPAEEDDKTNTVMSYTGVWEDQLGIYDIIALQSIYGPARRRLGDDTYQFGRDKLIWDGGGSDRITAAFARKAVTIDLHDGSWNHAGPQADSFLEDSRGAQVYLGNFTVIENLVGSDHDDRLTGNEAANRIIGGKGNDRIVGDIGDDVLQGGKGADRFVFLSAGDSTAAKAGRDRIGDFSRLQDDVLDLTALETSDASSLVYIGRHRFGQGAGEVNYTFEAGDTLVSVDLDGDGEADFSVLLDGKVRLQEDDFVL